jgi:hypothetical protein
VASHREAKKFDPSDEGSVVISKGLDAAFAAPVLRGSVLPQSVLQEWSNDQKTLEEWNDLFKASQQGLNFGSAAEFDARLREQQISEAYKTTAKKKGQQSSFLVSGLESLAIYPQAVETRQRESFQKGNPGRVSEVVLGVDAGLHQLLVSFFKHVKEAQGAIAGLELSSEMLEAHKKATSSLLGTMSLTGSSSFQNPTMFGTMSALARKVEEMDLAGPPVVDFSPIQADVKNFETKRVQTMIIDLSNRNAERKGEKPGEVAKGRTSLIHSSGCPRDQDQD